MVKQYSQKVIYLYLQGPGRQMVATPKATIARRMRNDEHRRRFNAPDLTSQFKDLASIMHPFEEGMCYVLLAAYVPMVHGQHINWTGTGIRTFHIASSPLHTMRFPTPEQSIVRHISLCI